MSDATDIDEDETEESGSGKSRKGMILVLVLGLVAGGGAFAVVWLGLLDSVLAKPSEAVISDPEQTAMSEQPQPDSSELRATPGAAFHPLDPISVSIGQGGDSRQLRVGVVLEIPSNELDNIIAIAPRLQDGILSYLRAVETKMVEDPTALLILRSQMLRRVRLIAGPEVIMNLLVTDFVLN